MPIIEVNHVTKEYRLGHMKSLKQTVLNTFSRLRGKPSAKQEPFKALDDIDFKVEDGEVFGIIGTNGASLHPELTGCENICLNGSIMGPLFAQLRKRENRNIIDVPKTR